MNRSTPLSIKGGRTAGRGLPALLLFLLMTSGIFRYVLSGRWVFYFGDLDKFFYPAKRLVGEAFAHGRLPVWDPIQMGGIPVLAHPLYAAAYPPTLFLALLPFNLGMGVFFALHFLLAGIFTYYLLLEFNLSTASSMVAALSFSFGGVMISSINLPPIFQTMTWFPMAALCYKRSLKKGSSGYLILSALAMALMFYGGEIHLTYLAMMIMLVWALTESWHKFWKGPESLGSVWPTVAIAIILLMGALLSLPVLLPAGVFTALSTRAVGIDFNTASMFSLRPGGLMGFVSPSLLFDQSSGTSWYQITGAYRTSYFLSLYAGAVPMALVLVGITAFGRKFTRLFLALLLVSVITALGKDLPLFMLVHRYVPFMDVFRYPEKMLVFTVFFMALFAGFGAETLLEWSAGENGGRRFGRLVKWFLPWVVIVGVALILLTVFGNRISAFVARVNIFGMPVSENAGSYAGYAGALIKDLLRVYGFIITLVLIAVLARTTQKGRLLLGPALVALTALDLYSAHVNLNRLAPEEYYLEPPAVVSHLKNEKGPYRIHPLIFEEKKGSLPLGFTTVFDIYIWEKEALKPNFGAMYGLHYADSESALRLMAQSNYINSAKRAPPGLKERLLGMYNVKYFIALYSQEKAIARDHADMELVQRFDDSGLLLYRNRRYLPRIYHVPAARFVDDQKQALDEIRREGFDPQKEVVITLSGRGDRSSPDPPPGSKKGADDMSTSTSSFSRKGVDIIEYSSSRVSAGASFEQEGYLVLSDVYYPGWEVVVDGKPAELLRANYLFRAVKLPAGTHFVRFQYTPRAFWKGIYAGPPLAGMGALLILIFHFTRRRAGKYT